MPVARGAGQAGDGRHLRPAVFAGILEFLCALIERVFSAVRAVRVAITRGAGQSGDVGCFGAAVFAVEIRHGLVTG